MGKSILKSLFPTNWQDTHALIKNGVLINNYTNTNMYGNLYFYTKDLDYTTQTYTNTNGIVLNNKSGSLLKNLIETDGKEEVVITNKLQYGDTSSYTRKTNLYQINFTVKGYSNNKNDIDYNSKLPEDIIFSVKCNTGTTHSGVC